MRSRDVTIPLTLWICAAICAHFLFGSGGLVVAKVHDDRSELWRLSHEASSLTQQQEQTIEVSFGDSAEDVVKPEEPPPPPPKPEEPPKPEPAPAPTKPVERTPPKEVEKPKEEKRVVIVEKKKDEPQKPVVLPEDPLKDRRIAVRQHAKADQEDNPTAKFVADEANHVDKETVASQTSHDRDDPNPTPAANHRSTEKEPGDSDKTRIADADEHKGEKNRAPGERGTDFDVTHEPKIPKPSQQPSPASTAQQPASPTPPTPTPAPGSTGNDNRPPAPKVEQAQPQPAPGGVTPPSPDVESAPEGSWSFNPGRVGRVTGVAPQPSAGSTTPNLPGGKMWSLPGLGQPSAPGAMNTNLNQVQVTAIVGSDNLRKLREADGERRKSEHRGAWASSNFDKWRSAIENYVSSVKLGNQTALNTAAVPFASYLNGMHNRIHPIFAESFLGSLDGLPPNHPMNNKKLVTRLEIVLTKEGHLKKMGIVATSGITGFDIAALDAVDRAQPFGPAPKAIVSPDGNVYLHWEFHRDEVFACSTMGARPYILNTPGPKNEEELPTPSTPSGPKERGTLPPSPNDAREGALPVPGHGRGTAVALAPPAE